MNGTMHPLFVVASVGSYPVPLLPIGLSDHETYTLPPLICLMQLPVAEEFNYTGFTGYHLVAAVTFQHTMEASPASLPYRH